MVNLLAGLAGNLEILPQLLINALITGSIYAIASAGLVLTFGMLRILNFAHGHLLMVGAYTFLFFHVQLDLPFLLAIPGSLVALLILGSISLLIFIQPFMQASPLLPFVTTIALGSMLEAVVSLLFGVNVRSFPSASTLESMQWYSIFVTPLQIVIIISALIVLTLLGIAIHLTPLGRKVRAIAENYPAAQGLGISKPAITFCVFLLSVLLTAYAGILIGYETNVQPTMGASYTIKAFAAMILGGLGNIWGTIAGSYILGAVENLAIGLDFWGYSLPAGYKDAFAFLIILGILLIRPQGIFGSRKRSV
jgi:branched-chain amino acid transport system permease protein